MRINELELLIRKYSVEIQEFTYDLAKLWNHMQWQNLRGGFGLLEGATLYALIRETKPSTVYEISPDTGLSTNYILAALKRNGFGLAVGFELDEIKGRGRHARPTAEVIRANQVFPEAFDDHYQLVLGDVVVTMQDNELSPPDITLIDSCHEGWFASWYLEHLIPQTRSYVLIQDIAYRHAREVSGEAEIVSKYLEEGTVNWLLVEDARFGLQTSAGNVYPVRNFIVNSILLDKTSSEASQCSLLPGIGVFEQFMRGHSDLSSTSAQAELLAGAFPGPSSPFSARYLAAACLAEPDPHIARTLRRLLIGEIFSSADRDKEVWAFLAIYRKFRISRAEQVCGKGRHQRLALIQVIFHFPFASIRIVRRRSTRWLSAVSK